MWYKRIVVIFSIFVLIALGSYLFFNWQSAQKAPATLLQLAPEKTSWAILIQDFEDLHSLDYELFYNKEYNWALLEDIDEQIKGLNLLCNSSANLKEWIYNSDIFLGRDDAGEHFVMIEANDLQAKYLAQGIKSGNPVWGEIPFFNNAFQFYQNKTIVFASSPELKKEISHLLKNNYFWLSDEIKWLNDEASANVVVRNKVRFALNLNKLNDSSFRWSGVVMDTLISPTDGFKAFDVPKDVAFSTFFTQDTSGVKKLGIRTMYGDYFLGSDPMHPERSFKYGERSYHVLSEEVLEQLGDRTWELFKWEHQKYFVSHYKGDQNLIDVLELDRVGEVQMELEYWKEALALFNMSLKTSSIQKSLKEENSYWIYDYAIGDSVELFCKEDYLEYRDKTGDLIWRKNLKAQLLGAPQQMDWYANGKFQVLWASRDSLYLIDRLGRDVEGFPKPLYHKAVQGITVVDYDDDGVYRILVPHLGGIDNYDKEGNMVDGWNGSMFDSPILPVQYFNIGDKDVLYVVDKTGKQYLFNRRGNSRYKGYLKKIDVEGLKSIELILNSGTSSGDLSDYTFVLRYEEGREEHLVNPGGLN